MSLYVNENASEINQSYATFEKDTKEDYEEEVSMETVENANYNIQAEISPTIPKVGETFTVTIKGVPEGIACSRGVSETKYKQIKDEKSGSNYVYTCEALEAGNDKFEICLWKDIENDSKLVYQKSFDITIKEKEINTGNTSNTGNTDYNIQIEISPSRPKSGETFTITVKNVPTDFSCSRVISEKKIEQLGEKRVGSNHIYTFKALSPGKDVFGYFIYDNNDVPVKEEYVNVTIDRGYSVAVSSDEVKEGNCIQVYINNLPTNWKWSYGLTPSGFEQVDFYPTYMTLRARKTGNIKLSIYIYNDKGKCVDTLDTNINIKTR